jgi:hypothetical protein
VPAHTPIPATTQEVVPGDLPGGAESRDTERTITLWHRSAATGEIPGLDSLDLGWLRPEGAYRFVIAGDEEIWAAVFIAYGSQFARLLELPAKPESRVPVLQQLPPRYRDLFAEGCACVVRRRLPVRFSGGIVHEGRVEVYRAAFMPADAAKGRWQLMVGTFNRKTLPQGDIDLERLRLHREEIPG